MSKVVYIFGAGASRLAGAPLMKDFLDVAEKLRGKVDPSEKSAFDLVFKAIWVLQPLYAKARLRLDNIESLFAAFEMALLCSKLPGLDDEERSQLIPSLKKVIAKTLDCSIDFPVLRAGRETPLMRAPVPYGDFVEGLADQLKGDTKRVSFITFNYDLALDYALHVEGLGTDYRLTDEVRTGQMVLLKLHGSLNWISRANGGGESALPWYLSSYFQQYEMRLDGRGWDRIRFGMLGHLRHFRPDGRDGEPCGDDATPFIVPPTWNKTRYHEGIARVWRAAARQLEEAEHIAVVGYSLPETDMFFRYLYAIGTLGEARLKTFLLVDPDTSGEVEGRFRGMLGTAAEERFRVVRKDFASALADLRKLAEA